MKQEESYNKLKIKRTVAVIFVSWVTTSLSLLLPTG